MGKVVRVGGGGGKWVGLRCGQNPVGRPKCGVWGWVGWRVIGIPTNNYGAPMELGNHRAKGAPIRPAATFPHRNGGRNIMTGGYPGLRPIGMGLHPGL